MIPISFNEKEAVNELYHLLLNIKKKQKDKQKFINYIRGINKWCLENIVVDDQSYSLSDIIRADYSKINKIVKVYNSKQIAMCSKHKKFILDILYQQRFPSKEFVEALQVTVCPYCNRNFINSTYKRTMCDLDHFYNKETYPFLAVSFYNLVPVCHACNHAKGSGSMSYSPHNSQFSTDDLLTFDFYITGMDYMFNHKQISIEIEYNSIFEDNVKRLKLLEVYQTHSDIVQECIKRAIIFNPEYLTDLYQTYDELFESEAEVYRIAYGYYWEESAYGKRPLSKLTKDILNNLLIEIYGFDICENI